jgi:ADP-ribose pyrophosphatase YjhB (NUDIX family)
MTELSVLPAVHIHAVIRRGGRFLMLYSEKHCYYKFPHGEKQTDETPVQAVCRIVSEQTGLTALPAHICPLISVNGQKDDGTAQMHEYYTCKVGGDPEDAVFPDSSRFRTETVSRGQALAANTQGDHGILAGDARLQAMLERDNFALRSVRRFSPLMLSIATTAGSLLIPVIGGLSCLLCGFHSPTDGAFVYGTDAFLIGLVLGIFPAGPAFVISLVSLALSLRDRRRSVHKPAAFILPCIALGIMLLYLWAAASFGNS